MFSWEHLPKILNFYFDYGLYNHLSLSNYLRLYQLLFLTQNPILSALFYYLSYLTTVFNLDTSITPNSLTLWKRMSTDLVLTPKFIKTISNSHPPNEWVLILFYYRLLRQYYKPIGLRLSRGSPCLLESFQ